MYNTVLHFILLYLEISSVSQMKGVSRLTAGHTLSPSEAMPALLEFELYEIAHVQVETQPQHLSVYEPWSLSRSDEDAEKVSEKFIKPTKRYLSVLFR